ncbi:MAG: lysophospholipid acyltransferase family protein [Roseinatronobacter sp.]
MRQTERFRLRHRLQDLLVGLALGLGRLLPYPTRIRAMGWFGAHVIGPVAGLRRRIRRNLALVAPDLPRAEVERLCRAVPGNMARAMAETFSGDTFIAHARHSPIEGTGWPALQAARDAGRPVVLVTAHFGNYDAARVVLRAQGCNVAGIYMPMRNPIFNRRYVAAMEHVAAPVFPRDRAGLAGLLRHLRQGGMIGLVADHYMSHGTLIDFMGQPARTALSAAEIALKQRAELIPVYAIRQPDGLDFRITVEAPIPHTDALTMTAALNASLETLIRAHMDQWMWTHRRWKRNQRDPSSSSGLGLSS